MTVEELIKELQGMPMDAEVSIAKGKDRGMVTVNRDVKIMHTTDLRGIIDVVIIE